MYDEIILFLASFLIWVMFAGLVLLWFVDGKIKKEQVVHALLASFIAWTVAEVMKRIFNTPRPFDVNQNLQTFTATLPLDPAFPSGHAATVFALAVTIWFHDRKVGIIFIVLAALVAWARVAANVHYPVDVIVGAMIGMAVAIAVEKVHLNFKRDKLFLKRKR
jgi:undecaprenyl-diphosphatase